MLRWIAIVIAIGIASPAVAQNLTLSSPGAYTLAADSTSTGLHNIYIGANDVTLDLNGKTVRCNPSSPSTAVTFGVYASGLQRVTIRNGKITGCLFGVHGGSSQYLTIEDVDFTGNTYIGANLGYGANNAVRRCVFASITGYSSEAYAIGINGIGLNGIIESNAFRDLYRQPGADTSKVGEGVGILVDAGATAVQIRANTLTNTHAKTATIGIWFASGASGTVSQNTITNAFRGVQGFGPVTATGNTLTLTASLAGSEAFSVGSGSAKDNTISGYDRAFSVDGHMTDDGNTILSVPTGKFFRICVDGVCYEGTLQPVP